MQQFVVPQFIDVEDKIFGPITVRQFLILLGDGVIGFIVYSLFEVYLFIAITVFLTGIAIVFAFVKVRGQTFHYFILNLIQFLRKPPLRIWNKQWTDDELDFLRKQDIGEEPVQEEVRKQPRRSHIRQLSLQVNTGGYYKAEDNTMLPEPKIE